MKFLYLMIVCSPLWLLKISTRKIFLNYKMSLAL